MQGVIGVYSKVDAHRKALYTLYGVQHRGQESAGLSAAGDHSLRTWKGRGLVSNVFNERFSSFTHPDDYAVIGCASGENTNQIDLPPYSFETARYEVSIAIDGYIQMDKRSANEMEFGGLLASKLGEMGPDTAMAETMKEISHACYSLVAVIHDKDEDTSELIAARGRLGVRPLYVACNGDELFVASESAPIDVLESMGQFYEGKRDVRPGSLLLMGEDGLRDIQVLEPEPAHCVFEWVYFGRPDSIIEGRTVHSVRKRLGHTLVKTHSLVDLYCGGDGEDDIVVIPVPDSGRSVCMGVTEALGIAADEGVIKNAYLGRTYIIDDPDFRKVASDLKHNIIRETVRGKKVVITDDSIVRGTVSESVAQNLLKAGASEVEFLVSYGPIYHPCFSDPPDKPLAAAPYKGEELNELGDLVASNLPSINKVRYNSPENVVRAIGLPPEKLCTYCMDGKDPFSEGRKPPNFEVYPSRQ
ncbi:MAG: hypothetical protein PVJ38_01710 [Candidatus Bathyarchaeota archaeon]|jgi:amidophosphoribosyltransferase